MATPLQELFPRRVFPKGRDGDRRPDLGEPWRRGGTTPGGASFSGPSITPRDSEPDDGQLLHRHGRAVRRRRRAAPRRLDAPAPGQERFSPATAAGFISSRRRSPASLDSSGPRRRKRSPLTSITVRWADYKRDVGRALPNPPFPVPGVTGGGATMPGASGGNDDADRPPRSSANRIVPMTAPYLGNDWDDTEEIVLWLSCAAETVFQGTIPTSGSSSRADGCATRGDARPHYQLVVNFSARSCGHR